MKLQIIKVPGKVSFGYERWIPINRPAELFTLLMRRKQFEKADLIWIKELGHEIEYLERAKK